MTTNPAIPQAIERAARAICRERTIGPHVDFECCRFYRDHATIAITAALQKPCETCKASGKRSGVATRRGDGTYLDCRTCNGSGFRSLLLVDPEGLRDRLIALAKKWPMTVPDDWQGREVEQQRKADIILALLQEEAS